MSQTKDRDSPSGEITRLLGQWSRSEPEESNEVLDRLIPLVYAELKLLAKSHRYRWSGPGHGTTSLVHEAYAKLARQSLRDFENRRQFYQLASKTMRSVLVDNARFQSRQKRGGNEIHVPLNEDRLVSASRGEELLALHESLERLESTSPELATVVECRCFAGLTIAETAEVLELSPATVKRRWSLARAWLYRALNSDEGA